MMLNLKQRKELSSLMKQHLDREDMRTLLLELGIDLGSVEHLSLLELAHELVRRVEFAVLLPLLRELNGAVDWVLPSLPQPKDEQPQIDLYHLPQPTTQLVGRVAELQQLDAALADDNIHSIALIAAGGVGKSAITHEWLQRQLSGFETDGTWVFAWSFYSQGAHETQTSALRFFEEAWRFFGGVGDAPTTDEQRGRGLATLLRQQRCVLVLDGLEPLQHQMDIQRGELKDQALRALLREARVHGLAESLVVISSRQPVVELSNCVGYRAINLERLSVGNGVQLLRRLGVEKGLPADFAAAAQHGHALSLVLLGHLLRRYFAGDVRCREQLPLLFEEREQGEHARRVIAAHAERLTEAQRVFMRMMGLFDRPMAEGEKDVLLAQWKSAKALAALSSLQWTDLLSDLRAMGLLLDSDDGYDTHPLIRSFFEETDPAAHRILFDYFQQIPEKQQPDTLEELEPLYRAVHHGCLAGEHNKAGGYIYMERIIGGRSYSIGKFGLAIMDLEIISNFFQKNWKKPVEERLPKSAHSWLLHHAARCLMSLGRFKEAKELYQLSISIMEEKPENLKNLSTLLGNLFELEVSVGDLLEAESIAYQELHYANSIGMSTKKYGYCNLATVLYLKGNLSGSLTAFQETGVTICDVDYHPRDISPHHKAQYVLLCLELGEDLYAVCDFSCDSFGKAYFHLILSFNRKKEECYSRITCALIEIKKSNWINHVPHFLLYRAQFHHDQHNPTDAWRDLIEAEEIIQNCDMALYAVDAHLLRGHLLLTSNPPDNDTGLTDPIACIDAAEQGIQTTGYHLRDAELHLLKAVAYPEQKDHYLNLAQQRIEEIGQFGLLGRLEKCRLG